MHFLCLSLSCPSVELVARFPPLSCAINIHTVELSTAQLEVPAGSGAQPGLANIAGVLFAVGPRLYPDCFGAD